MSRINHDRFGPTSSRVWGRKVPPSKLDHINKAVINIVGFTGDIR